VLVKTKHIGYKEMEKWEEFYTVDYVFVHTFMLVQVYVCAFMCSCASMLIIVIH
jgi:hypothetical protein